MKPIFYSCILLLLLLNLSLRGQKQDLVEKFGNTLNAGIGAEFADYIGYSVPVACLSYEFQIDKNITVAPFILAYSYKATVTSADVDLVLQNYSYSETAIPIGLKVSYYFDEILNIGKRWDLYAAGSLGFIYRQTQWSNNYQGKNNHEPGTGPMYLNLHLGTEYHFNQLLGVQMDISPGKASLGLAIHL